MIRHTFFTLLFVLIGVFVSAQTPEKLDTIPPTGNDLVNQGVELYDKGKAEEAIKKYKLVSPYDPAYVLACYETALAYDDLSNYDAALLKCEESLALDSADVHALVMKGSILDELNRTKEAIKWLEGVEKKYPFNQNLLYNLGLCYLNNKEIQKAENILIKGLHYNPYHGSSHMALARINMMMGRKAQAYLAYNMGIMMNPRLDYVKRFEEAISGKMDSISKSYLHPYPQGYDHAKWDDLTGLLNAEVAFREDFPYDYKLNFLSCRQTFLLFQKMKFDEKDTTFYNQSYVRLFRKVCDNNDLETYLYYSLKNTDNQAVNEWQEKNKSKNDGFVDQIRTLIDLWKEYGFSSANEAKHQKVVHSTEKGTLESVGILTEAPQPSKEGPWYFISNSGAVNQKGNYKNNKREGEFKLFWWDGNLKQHLNYKNDLLDGQNYTFHPNGAKSGIYPRTNGITDGAEEEYDSAKNLISRTQYKNGKAVGKSLFTNYDTGFSREVSWINDKLEGKMVEKWLNGNLKTEAAYVDSLLQGSYKKWYGNGQPEWEGNYDKGVQTGKWFSWYPSGVKSAEGTFDATGNPTGIYSEYDHNGKLSSRIEGYKNGKPDGVQSFYFPDGKVQARLILKEDVFKHVEWFNLLGERVYEADEKEGELLYKFFFPEGSPKIEGKFLNGQREGIWKNFNVLGKVISAEQYHSGMQSGPQKYFHPNGTLSLVYACDSGKIIGKAIRYGMKGHITMTGHYDGEGSTGKWTTYYSNDSIESVAFYAKGKPVGKKISFSPDGKPTMEETFNESGERIAVKNFDQDGKVIDDVSFPYGSLSYTLNYQNGKPKAKFSVSDRKFNGIQENYFPNGKLKSSHSSIFGNMQGPSQEWDHYGKIVDSRNFCMNEMDGKWTEYKNGKLLTIDSYEMGANQGLFQEYHPNGHLFRAFMEEGGERQGNSDCYATDSTWMYGVQYLNDVAYGVSYLDNQGKLHANERIDDSKKEIVCYSKDGKVSARLPFAKGIFEGKHSIYYSNGKLQREINYVNDYREGQSKYYYENGILKELYNWKNGTMTGPFNSYFPTGQKEMEGNYISNKKTGKWLVYNQSGKVIETLFYSNDELYDIK